MGNSHNPLSVRCVRHQVRTVPRIRLMFDFALGSELEDLR
jgi:hypothetical protein